MSKDKISGKYVFITGADGEIGQVCALAMDNAGVNVIAGVYPDLSRAEKLIEKASDRLKPLVINSTDEDSIAAAKKEIESIVGSDGLYGVINMAGLSGMGPVEFFPMKQLKMVFAVNVFGTFGVTQAMIPLVRKTQGYIINISSDAGLVSYPFAAPYCSSKFAIEAISDALRVELKPWNIKVVLIEPGNVQTEMWQKAVDGVQKQIDSLPPEAVDLYAEEYKKWASMTTQGMPPERIAETIIDILSSEKPKTRYVVGEDAQMTQVISYMPDELRDTVVWKFINSYQSEEKDKK